MFSISSSRRLVSLVLCVTLFLLLIRLFRMLWFSQHATLDELLLSTLPSGTPAQSLPVKTVLHGDFSDAFAFSKKLLPNNYTAPLLRCSLKSNNATNAIRLPIPILNISLTPPNAIHKTIQRHFNPTIIPLPPYSPYPYLLLSRLVTEGLHQESHICLATSCTPRNNTQRHTPSTDSRTCDGSDIEVLGPHGGLRCATTPEKLNIPPTPAYRCEGAWAAFPDIPGFHDPRVFWSGKGEPLVIVNSASQYACVGLWIVDLRAVYPELDELLSRKGKYNALNWSKENGIIDVPARMSYPHLTELTRNPRSSRNAVEKNWILFFPQGDESWVQYDLVAHGGHKQEDRKDEHHMDGSLLAALDERVRIATNRSTDGTAKNGSDSTITTVRRQKAKSDQNITINDEDVAQEVNRTQVASTLAADFEHFKRSRTSTKNPGQKFIPSRSFAKLIGSGYTTTNLTSPYETPCLDSDNLLDSHGNKGHWHQGSNSLRLILCSRQDLACLSNDNEGHLVESGKIVHFAILHRKFSNSFKLPMRYERYLMVWEARFPFRMLGLSQYPILFAGEKAQPWTDAENELQKDQDAERWKNVYFTYTPSLAWSWRKESVRMKDDAVKRGQGTGYLGDDVLVGIGMDDIAHGFVKVKVEHLLSCLRLCPDFQTAG